MNIKGKFFTYSGGGLVYLARAIVQETLQYSPSIAQIVYNCTTCGACNEMCSIITVPKLRINPEEIGNLLKAELVRRGFGPFPPHKKLSENIKLEYTSDGSYSQNYQTDRLNWLPENIKAKLLDKAEILLYTGCIGSYLETQIPRALVNILTTSGIEFTVSPREKCCGLPLYTTGQWSLL
jgi:Fe-S oxidoreductase